MQDGKKHPEVCLELPGRERREQGSLCLLDLWETGENSWTAHWVSRLLDQGDFCMGLSHVQNKGLSRKCCLHQAIASLSLWRS